MNSIAVGLGWCFVLR